MNNNIARVNSEIKIDVAFESDNELLELMAHWTKLNINYKVINAKGPGAGWPEIKLFGDNEILCNELKRMGYDDEFIIEYVEVDK